MKVEIRCPRNDSHTLTQLASQFCLSNTAVSVVIPGGKTPEQLRENAKTSELKSLTREELSMRLFLLSQRLNKRSLNIPAS